MKKNARPRRSKPGRNAGRSYHDGMNGRRIVAAIFAILLAIAMLLMYVIDVGTIAGYGDAPVTQTAGAGLGQTAETAARGNASVNAADGGAFDADSAAGADGAGDLAMQPSPEEDAANAAQAIELAGSDLAAAADCLAAIGDTRLYESTLRAILNARYEDGNSNEDLLPFTSRLGPRGTPIAGRYANAYDERSAGFDNGYIPAELLLVADSKEDPAFFDEQALRDIVPDTMGEVTGFMESNGQLIATVDLTLEWSVQDAAASFEEDGLHAQPDYIYYIMDTEDPADPDGSVGDENNGSGTTGSGNGTTGSGNGTTGSRSNGDNGDAPDAAASSGNGADNVDDGTAANDSDSISSEDNGGSNDGGDNGDPGDSGAGTDPENEPTEELADFNKLFSVSSGSFALQECREMLSPGRQPVRVGVLDTGVYSAHEDLDDALARDPDTGELLSGKYSNGAIVPGDVTERDTGKSTSYHGTHVCGIIAAELNGEGTSGVAAGYAELVVVSGYVFNSRHNTWGFTSTSLTEGINYLTETDCRIINLSLGGTTPYDDMPVMGAIENAVDSGVLLVAAAGNRIEGGTPPYIGYPGWYPGTIGVINALTSTRRYTGSNYGPDYDIAAPGCDLYSTITNSDLTASSYGKKTGTSMAAPVITGTAAMMLYEDPTLTAAEIRNILYAAAGNQLPAGQQPAAGTVNTRSAFEGAPENVGNQLGFGYVDPAAAIGAVKSRAYGTDAPTYADYLELNRTAIDLPYGDRTSLDFRLLPANAKVSALAASGSPISWTSSNTSVAKVDESGVIRATGTGGCTVTGMIRGAGRNGSDLSASVTVSVGRADITDATVAGVSDYVYTGRAITPSPSLTLPSGTALNEGTDYSVSYSNNISPGEATITFTGRGNCTGQTTVTFRILPRGWYQEDGEWYYYTRSGEKLTSGWAKDSTGWCWMDENGRITKSKWIEDQGEWYYLKADGYMAANEWARDSKGWMWMGANGKVTRSKWIQDKGEWYFLKADGYMAAGEWAKDKTGWMWMGTDGKVTKSKWIQDNDVWYYLKSDGYMAASQWIKSGGKWYWLEANGKMAKDKWISYNGDRYYVNSSGSMVTGRLIIGGRTYWFDASGKLIR